MEQRKARRPVPPRWWAVAAVVCTGLILLLVLSQRPQGELTAPAPGETLLAAAEGLDEITIDAVFDPVSRTLETQQTLTLQNRTGATQRMIVFRTYPNAFLSEDTSPAATTELYDACYPDGFSVGRLTFSAMKLLTAEGALEGLPYAYGDNAHTELRVSLPADWLPGETVTLRMAYTVRVPQLAYRFGESGGIWALGNTFVIPSPWVDGAYRTDEYSSIGEPFISQCRNYTVQITAPQAYTVASTGTAASEAAADGQTLTTISAPAVRDFALCLSAGYQRAQVLQNGVLVQAYARTVKDAEAMLATARKALESYTACYGAYPYPTLSLCQADLPFDTATYPGLCMVASDQLAAGGEALTRTIARTVAKQWWAAIVGIDGFNQAWQADALAAFSLLDYWEAQNGASARADLQYSLVDSSLRVTVARGVTPGSPVDYFSDWSEYTLVVTARGAAALCALDTAMNGGLDAFLAHYYQTYAFALTTREDFETLLRMDTGEDWSPLLTDYLDTYMNT